MRFDEQVRVMVSVHDLMPHTLDAVLGILSRLERHHVRPVTLLVVPGAGWTAPEIGRLRRLQKDGYHLAGHGWRHQARSIRGLRHRLHSRLISRHAAEHLSLGRGQIVRVMERCHAWFHEVGLAAPEYYVPPAWALGAVTRQQLATLSFRAQETQTGILDNAAGAFRPVPLLGYEADRAWCAPVLRAWNAVNRTAARRSGTLRLAIHPLDLELPLAGDLTKDLERYRRFVGYAQLVNPSGGSLPSYSNEH